MPNDNDAQCRVPETERPQGVLWWSFYERDAHFSTFVRYALRYCTGGTADFMALPSTYERVLSLVEMLRRRRLLLVLDGYERELRAYSSLSAAYQGDVVKEDDRADFRRCSDPNAGLFLEAICSAETTSKILITSRLFPSETDELSNRRRESLTSLDVEDAIAFFLAQGIHGTRAEIHNACAPYGYHPLALRLLSGMVMRDPGKPGDITASTSYVHLAARA